MANEDTTESGILSNIPDLNDNTADAVNDAPSTTTQETASNATAVNTGTVDANTSEGSTSNTSTEPVAITRRDGLIEKPSATDPRTRDLVDPATGQVVAHGGVERRMFESAQRLHKENASLQQRVAAAEEKAGTFTEVDTLGTTLALSKEDQITSLNVMAAFLKDPVKTLEQLVIEVKSKGYHIPFLDTGITPGMDTAAIQRMVDQRMAPITDAKKQEQELIQRQDAARATLDDFLDTNPEGVHNLTVLAEMMTKEPGLSLNSAFVKLIKWCTMSGLDYSQPIAPQIAAKQTNPPAGNTVQMPTQPRNQPPLPSNRQTREATPMVDAATFNENTSWEDIIRHAMSASG